MMINFQTVVRFWKPHLSFFLDANADPEVPDTGEAPVNQLASPPMSLPETLSEGNPETV